MLLCIVDGSFYPCFIFLKFSRNIEDYSKDCFLFWLYAHWSNCLSTQNIGLLSLRNSIFICFKKKHSKNTSINLYKHHCYNKAKIRFKWLNIFVQIYFIEDNRSHTVWTSNYKLLPERTYFTLQYLSIATSSYSWHTLNISLSPTPRYRLCVS